MGADGSVTMNEARPKRECPVPRPGGLVGQIMGFERTEREAPTEVVVKTLKTRKVAMRDESGSP